MRTIAIAVAALLLTACSTLTENQKNGLKFAAGVVVVGMIAAHGSGGTKPPGDVGPPLSCAPQPNGSCR
jgi:hypothetical protein